MSRDNLVRRLISFLKRPDALSYDEHNPVHNPYDDYTPREVYQDAPVPASVPDFADVAPLEVRRASTPINTEPEAVFAAGDRTPGYASRLDALVMRALQQFNAQFGFVVRYDQDGRMRYLTGRDVHGQYVAHTTIDPDRQAVFVVLESGESQLFMQQMDGHSRSAVLCGPLWVDNEVVGVLYLDGPMHNRTHRGVFDVFCNQAARLLTNEYVM